MDRKAQSPVVLWRGTSPDRALAMRAHGSAGGVPANAAVAAPSEEERLDQIAHGAALPEFSAEGGQTSWSFGSAMVVVQVNTRYLARGSSAESGWVCFPNAPVTVLALIDRRLDGKIKKFGGNAS